MNILFVLLLSFTILAQNAEKIQIDKNIDFEIESMDHNNLGSSVYCGYYYTHNNEGYSIYRSYGRKDLGNSYWLNNASECFQAADMANYKNANLVCSKYYLNEYSSGFYSLYRISDGRDLGNAAFGSFQNCNDAVYHSRNGIFCAPYKVDDYIGVKWSKYSVRSGTDIGKNYYHSFQDCISHLSYHH